MSEAKRIKTALVSVYHKESYLELHPTGPKHDYDYHTEAMDRAMEGEKAIYFIFIL